MHISQWLFLYWRPILQKRGFPNIDQCQTDSIAMLCCAQIRWDRGECGRRRRSTKPKWVGHCRYARARPNNGSGRNQFSRRRDFQTLSNVKQILYLRDIVCGTFQAACGCGANHLEIPSWAERQSECQRPVAWREKWYKRRSNHRLSHRSILQHQSPKSHKKSLTSIEVCSQAKRWASLNK